MKKISSFVILTTLALIISLISLPANSVHAALADGTHSINYEVQKAGGGGVSIADGYFSKPAKLTVNGSTHTIQLTLTSADMIKSLSVGGAPVQVVSDNGDTRVIKFNVSDASKPVNMAMHVTVPDLYDQDHSAQAVFDVSGVPAQASTPAPDEDEENATPAADSSSDNGANEEVVNPPTGDNTPIGLYIALLVGSIVLFGIYKFRFARN